MTSAFPIPRTTLAALAAVCAAAGTATAATGDGSGGAAFGSAETIVGGPALYARPGIMLGGTLSLRGTTTPGAQVGLERRDPRTGAWSVVATAVSDARGGYVGRWRPDAAGVVAIRIAPVVASGARAAQAPATITVTIFKPATATWYGPGLYGRKTACGQRLTTTLVGVAHRTLPCGRMVQLLYNGRTISVPVVDRGPFHHKADWDLTTAAARQLGLVKTSRIGAMALPSATATAAG